MFSCPDCNVKLKVKDSREAPDNQIRRRRFCGKCGRRFTTYEGTRLISDEVILGNLKSQLRLLLKTIEAVEETNN